MTIGIIGHGAFGAFTERLLTRFAPDVTLRIHSSRTPADGTRFFSLEDACAVDALVLCVPIPMFASTLERIADCILPTTVVVDVCTVKVHTVEALKRFLPGQPYIATHPMFGPESYAKRGEDITGFRIVVTAHDLLPDDYRRLLMLLRSLSFDVVEMSPEAHDRHLARTLFLTHYVGQIILDAKFERTEIDTVSFGYLMDAVESIRHDKALFEDVFRYNPYCLETVQEFEKAEIRVRSWLTDGDILAI